MWRRAALAALVSVIALLTVEEDHPLWRRERPVISKPEIAVAVSSKGISVFDSAIQVDRLPLPIYIVNFLGAQGASVPERFWHLPVSPQGRVKLVLEFWCNQRFFVLWFGDCNLCPANDLIGGRLPSIFECHDHSRFVSVLREWRIQHHAFKNIRGMWKNVSAQLPTSGSHHDPNGSDQSEKLKESNKDRNSCDPVTQTPTPEPTIAPLLYSMVAGGLGFFLCLFGLLNLDDNRRLIAAVQLGCGLLLGGFSFLLWVL